MVTHYWVTARPSRGHGRENWSLVVDCSHPQWPNLSLSSLFFFFFFFTEKVIEGGWWVAASGQVILYLGVLFSF
jgi:hypothetical protein